MADYYRFDDKSNPEPIASVLKRWANVGDKLYDSLVHAFYSADEIWDWREYTWTRETSRSGVSRDDTTHATYTDYQGPEKWDAIKKDMSQNGWEKQDPLILVVGKNGCGKVGEGNHRLAIAKELGIDKVPVRFVFYTVVNSDEGQVKRLESPRLDEILLEMPSEMKGSGASKKDLTVPFKESTLLEELERVLLEAAIDKIKAKFPGREDEWDQAQQYLLDNGIKESQLPTYLNWLARQSQNSTEPLRDVVPLIVVFHIFKDQPSYWKLPKDINAFDRDNLEAAAETMPDLNKKEPTGPIEPKFVSGSGIWEVYVPMSEEESVTIANMEGTTSWCTARTKGENLFNSYIFGGAILFYVLDSRGRENKYSIGTLGGQIQKGKGGSLTVNKDNGAFTDQDQEEQFGSERAEILGFIQKFSDGIQGKHPAAKGIENGISSLPKWIHMTKNWQQKTISSTAHMVIKDRALQGKISRDLFVHFLKKAQSLKIASVGNNYELKWSHLLMDIGVLRWVKEYLINNRPLFNDAEKKVIKGIVREEFYPLTSLRDVLSYVEFPYSILENPSEVDLDLLHELTKKRSYTGQDALRTFLSLDFYTMNWKADERILSALSNEDTLASIYKKPKERVPVIAPSAREAMYRKWEWTRAEDFGYEKLNSTDIHSLCSLSMVNKSEPFYDPSIIYLTHKILDGETAVKPTGPPSEVLWFLDYFKWVRLTLGKEKEEKTLSSWAIEEIQKKEEKFRSAFDQTQKKSDTPEDPSDKLADILAEMLLTEAAIDKIKAKFPRREDEWDQVQQYLLDNGIKESQLPAYLNWIARQATERMIGFDKPAMLAARFHALKGKRSVWHDDDDRPYSVDINNFDLDSLKLAIESVPDVSESSLSTGDKAAFTTSSGKWSVYVPSTQEESVKVANKGESVTWCTAKAQGENLFYAYAFAGVTLFYILDNQDESNKFCIGTNEGARESHPRAGGITVDKDNQAFVPTKQRDVFGEEFEEIVNFIDGYDTEGRGASHKVLEATRSLSKWKSLIKDWRPENIFAVISSLTSESYPISKGVFIWIFSKAYTLKADIGDELQTLAESRNFTPFVIANIERLFPTVTAEQAKFLMDCARDPEEPDYASPLKRFVFNALLAPASKDLELFKTMMTSPFMFWALTSRHSPVRRFPLETIEWIAQNIEIVLKDKTKRDEDLLSYEFGRVISRKFVENKSYSFDFSSMSKSLFEGFLREYTGNGSYHHDYRVLNAVLEGRTMIKNPNSLDPAEDLDLCFSLGKMFDHERDIVREHMEEERDSEREPSEYLRARLMKMMEFSNILMLDADQWLDELFEFDPPNKREVIAGFAKDGASNMYSKISNLFKKYADEDDIFIEENVNKILEVLDIFFNADSFKWIDGQWEELGKPEHIVFDDDLPIRSKFLEGLLIFKQEYGHEEFYNFFRFCRGDAFQLAAKKTKTRLYTLSHNATDEMKMDRLSQEVFGIWSPFLKWDKRKLLEIRSLVDRLERGHISSTILEKLAELGEAVPVLPPQPFAVAFENFSNLQESSRLPKSKLVDILAEMLLTEAAIDKIKSKFPGREEEWDAAQQYLLDNGIKESQLPSYLNWLARQPPEPLRDIVPLIVMFNQFKDQPFYWKVSKDINSFDRNSLEAAVEKMPDLNKKEATGPIAPKFVSSSGIWEVYVPMSEQESITIANMEGTTSWCTARTKGENLFNSYIFGDVILFYVLDSRGRGNKYSIGTAGGRIQEGQYGSVTVTKDNKSFTDDMQKQQFGKEIGEIRDFIQSFSDKIEGQHPAKKEIRDALTSLPKWKHLTRSWKPTTVATTLQIAIENKIPIEKDLSMDIIFNLDNFTVTDENQRTFRFHEPYSVRSWISETYTKNRPTFSDEHKSAANHILESQSYSSYLTGVIRSYEGAHFLRTHNKEIDSDFLKKLSGFADTGVLNATFFPVITNIYPDMSLEVLSVLSDINGFIDAEVDSSLEGRFFDRATTEITHLWEAADLGSFDYEKLGRVALEGLCENINASLEWQEYDIDAEEFEQKAVDLAFKILRDETSIKKGAPVGEYSSRFMLGVLDGAATISQSKKLLEEILEFGSFTDHYPEKWFPKGVFYGIEANSQEFAKFAKVAAEGKLAGLQSLLTACAATQNPAYAGSMKARLTPEQERVLFNELFKTDPSGAHTWATHVVSRAEMIKKADKEFRGGSSVEELLSPNLDYYEDFLAKHNKKSSVNESKTNLVDLLAEMLLTEAAIDKIKLKFPGREEEWDAAQQYLLDNGIKESQLPSYLNWLARQPPEPLRDIVPLIVMFNQFKGQPFYWKASKDINSFDRNSLEAAVEKMPDLNKKETTGPIAPKFISGSGIWEVYVPMSEQESITIANMEGTTSWCTARTKGENLFNSYIFGDVILFYVLDSRGRGNKYSIGTANGRIQKGGEGGVTVTKDNRAFIDRMQEEQFGPEKVEIMSFIQKFSDGIQGKHPAKKRIEDGLSSLPKWLHMTRSWKPQTISTTLLVAIEKDVPIAKDTALHIIYNSKNLTITGRPYSDDCEFLEDWEAKEWALKTYSKYRPTFTDDEIRRFDEFIEAPENQELQSIDEFKKLSKIYTILTSKADPAKILEDLAHQDQLDDVLTELFSHSSPSEAKRNATASEEMLSYLSDPEKLISLLVLQPSERETPSDTIGYRAAYDAIDAQYALFFKWNLTDKDSFNYGPLSEININNICGSVPNNAKSQLVPRREDGSGIMYQIPEKTFHLINKILNRETAFTGKTKEASATSHLMSTVFFGLDDEGIDSIVNRLRHFPNIAAKYPSMWARQGLLRGVEESSLEFASFVEELLEDLGKTAELLKLSLRQKDVLTPEQEKNIFLKLHERDPRRAYNQIAKRVKGDAINRRKKSKEGPWQDPPNLQFYIDYVNKWVELDEDPRWAPEDPLFESVQENNFVNMLAEMLSPETLLSQEVLLDCPK